MVNKSGKLIWLIHLISLEVYLPITDYVIYLWRIILLSIQNWSFIYTEFLKIEKQEF